VLHSKWPPWLKRRVKSRVFAKHRARARISTAMAEEDEDGEKVCIGNLCFLKPYPHYSPPPYYPRIHRKNYRWKIGAQVKTSPEIQCKLSHSLTLPNALGLGPEARWRWQWLPVSLMTSIVMHLRLHHQSSPKETQGAEIYGARSLGVGVSPRARLKVLTPVFGRLALLPMVELLPTHKLMVRREFLVRNRKLSLQADLEFGTRIGLSKLPRWSFQVNWHPADAVKMTLQSVGDVCRVQCARSFSLAPGRKGIATGDAEIPSTFFLNGGSKFGSMPVRARLESLKVSHIITDEAAKTTPLPTSTYLDASERIGDTDLISVIPGHWIDPGNETGAPGEPEFNMDVANVLERQLMRNGWKVLRPEREAPELTWEEYLNWVSKQTSQGIPVLEIHGQGSDANNRGIVVGVIGDASAPLNRELAEEFGYYKMNWRDLGVPKRGGAILESFNADEVLQMAPWHRKWSVRRIANRIVSCIERASHNNRASRGVSIELRSDDEN
jgi:hypothetical protein